MPSFLRYSHVVIAAVACAAVVLLLRQFWVALAFEAVATVFAALAWLESAWLLKQRPHRRRHHSTNGGQARSREAPRSRTVYRTLKHAGIVVIVTIGIVTTVTTYVIGERFALAEREGILVPDSLPSPSLSRAQERADEEPEAFRVFLGPVLAMLGKDEMSTVVLSLRDRDIITLRREREQVLLDVRFTSEDGNASGRLVDNRLTDNPENYFRIERPDRHTLIVRDLRGIQVFKAHFVNLKNLILVGVFQSGQGESLNVTPESVGYGEIRLGEVIRRGSRALFEF